MVERREDMFDDESICLVKSEIRVDRSNHSFEGIREDIAIVMSSCERLSSRELDGIREIQAFRDFC